LRSGGALAAVLLCLPAASTQAQAQDYIGASACGACHAAQFQLQSKSGHARALYPAAEHPIAKSFPLSVSLKRPPAFNFSLERGENGFRMRASDGRTQMETPIDWAFGSGTHGVTFVSRLAENSYLEHSFSFFTNSGTLDLTPGHRSLPVGTLMQAAGQHFRVQGSGFTIRNCFQCHSTGPVSAAPNGSMNLAEHGVRCEACHGPGRLHAEAARSGEPRRVRQTIRGLRKSAADDLNQLCGGCHRSPQEGLGANDFTNPWNVRHQPPYLEQSNCFRKSAGALSCLTCHGPHESLRRNEANHYNRQCSTCHQGPRAKLPAKVCRADANPDCTGCHMPAVAADPNLRFRNHWIGIYGGGSSLIPAR
jgi:Cytochrome c554 and c-prime